MEIPFHRSMTASDVMRQIRRAFGGLGDVNNIQFLQARQDNTLHVTENQHLDGVGVIKLAGVEVYAKQSERSNTVVIHDGESEESNEFHGCLYSVEWNDGMERWNGMVEWNSGTTTHVHITASIHVCLTAHAQTSLPSTPCLICQGRMCRSLYLLLACLFRVIMAYTGKATAHSPFGSCATFACKS